MLATLKEDMEEGRQLPCVYTAHLLEDSFEVKDATKLSNVDHSNFFNDKAYPRMTPALKEKDASFRFKVLLDADATSLHTDTLRAIKGCLRIHNKPQYGAAKKLKHFWNGESLSNTATFVLGYKPILLFQNLLNDSRIILKGILPANGNG
jgi:hypothetical protein